MLAPTTSPQRRYDLDWLRVLAFGLLIFFHTGMFFVEWEWHIKNNVISEPMEWPMRFVSQWRMPLLFMISGAALYFALRRPRTGSFAGERVRRILLPLIFGMFVVVPPQIYFERLTQGHAYGYAEFYASVFAFEPYPAGSFSWHHLWYLAYLFVYSLVCLPLFRYWLREPGTRQLDRIIAFFARPGFVFLPAAWLLAGDLVLRPYFPDDTHALVDDWANHFKSLSLFVIGFGLVAQPAFISVVARQRWVSLGVGLCTVAVLYARYWLADWPGGLQGGELTLYRALAFLNGWSWLLTLLGFARTHLNFTNPALRYANEAVYPFYILHQTVIIVLAYPMIDWTMPVGVKFLLISLGTFGVCWLLYEGPIRRVAFLRPLFGLKARKDDRPEAMRQRLAA
ncbi:MAG: Putative inner membrane protein [uncultured Cytophagales bacterium]|uniref:Inner membrane protein n=1 Tax=uncultured Cytophagales bacterium TaxID=158755 RepID=A0A6J4JFX7_9SPHI|nr:MAG: Putative inner membrane protein [uncultured Cytophagales bacterium]